jgi:undecaprenyl-diphosphatase
MELSYPQALILGLVQGLTEFLPISSSAHLAWVEAWMHMDGGSASMLFVDLMLHIGTVIAIVIVFFAEFLRFFRRLYAETHRGFAGPRIAWRITLLGILASVPTAFIGWKFKDELEESFGRPFHIGLELILSGFILWGVTFVRRPRNGWKRFKWWHALLVGIGQAFAIVPGISRSGTTIAAGIYTGLRRQWAGEFSFFIGMPAICGAAFLQTWEMVHKKHMALGVLLTGPVIAGSVVALLSGVVALVIVMRSLRKGKFQYFCYYCWVVGALALIVFRHAQ